METSGSTIFQRSFNATEEKKGKEKEEVEEVEEEAL